jgi:hypothetical protein
VRLDVVGHEFSGWPLVAAHLAGVQVPVQDEAAKVDPPLGVIPLAPGSFGRETGTGWSTEGEAVWQLAECGLEISKLAQWLGCLEGFDGSEWELVQRIACGFPSDHVLAGEAVAQVVQADVHAIAAVQFDEWRHADRFG